MSGLVHTIKFKPGILGVFANPFYISRKHLYRAMWKHAPKMKGRILDVGCGQKPYRGLFQCDEYVGMDIEQSGHAHANEQIDVFYDGKHFPFADEAFDYLVCNQVLEHVFNPHEFMTEMNRVLKKGGGLLMTVPFVWDEHEQPYDYARYTQFGLKHILRQHGFEIQTYEKLGTASEVLFQMANCMVYKSTLRLRRTHISNLLATLVFNAPINIAGSLLGWMFSKKQDLFLDSCVFAQKG